MKRRAFFSVLAAVATLLLTAAAVVAVWIGSHSPLVLLDGGTRAEPEAAVLVPKNSPLVLSLLANPDRLENLRQAVTPLRQRRRSRNEWHRWRDRLLAKTGLSYPQDLRPWLGDELTLALLPPTATGDGATRYLLAAAVADAPGAAAFLENFWQRQALAGISLIFEEYKGAKLVYGQALDVVPKLGNQRPDRTDLATALLGDRFVLLANSPEALHTAIDTAQVPSLSLASNPDYRRALTTLPEERLALAVVRGPGLAAAWRGNQASQTKPLPVDHAVLSLDLEATGIALEGVLLASDPDTLAERTAPLAEPVAALGYLPAEAVLAIGGQNLTQLATVWGDRLAGTGIDQQLRPLWQGLAAWATGAQDAFAATTGDYALGLLPLEADSSPQTRAWGEFPAEAIFVARRSPALTEALAQWDAAAEAQGLTTGQIELGGPQPTPATVWTKLIAPSRGRGNRLAKGPKVSTQVLGAHTTVTGPAGDYELLATSVGALDRALVADETGRSLASSPTFEQAIAPLHRPNEGLVYLAWRQGRTALERALPALRLAEVAAQPLLEKLDSIAVDLAGGPADARRVSLFARWRLD